MTKFTRFLVCGPGLIGRKHIELILKRPDCELVGVVGQLGTSDEASAASAGVPIFGSLEQAIGCVQADAVVISSPNAMHHDQALLCARAGLPALIEKPLTDDLETAADLVEAFAAAEVPALVGHHRAHSPLLQVAKDFLESPSFGQLVCVNGSALFYKPAHYFVDGPWRTRIGGGPLLINLIHEVGLMRYFCGEIVDVYARASHKTRYFEVEDTVSMSFQFENGCLGNFMLSDCSASSKSWEMTSGENKAYPHFPDEDCYHFSGTRGSLDFPSMRVRTYDERTDPSWWNPFHLSRLSFVAQDPLELQLAHFVDVIRHGEKPRVSLKDGYMNMRVVEAVRNSIQSGKSVGLSLGV